MYLLQPAKQLVRGRLVKPLFLLGYQLRKFVAIDPVLFNYLGWVHLVIEGIMFSFTIEATHCIIILLIVNAIDLI